ncbi:hypothetical protein L3Y34_012286 [Caenorhabditis briggsae]|uniref:Uncharacterized protein n=1 Tax=Caenorhabditis briggsae TaxID=6238 RepID=A0AAE9CWE6_CAEBR|nr:hypothetical protein L3Y34_012286 [Caenorhabditis briggsae]
MVRNNPSRMLSIKASLIILVVVQFIFSVPLAAGKNGTLAEDIAEKLINYLPSQENISNIAAQKLENNNNNDTFETDEGSVRHMFVRIIKMRPLCLLVQCSCCC